MGFTDADGQDEVPEAWYPACAFQGLLYLGLLAATVFQAIVRRSVDHRTRRIQDMNLFICLQLIAYSVDPYGVFGIYNWEAQMIFQQIIEVSLVIGGISVLDRIVVVSCNYGGKTVPAIYHQVSNFGRVLLLLSAIADPIVVFTTDNTKWRFFNHVIKSISILVCGAFSVYYIHEIRIKVLTIVENKMKSQKSMDRRVLERALRRHQRIKNRLRTSEYWFLAVVIFSVAAFIVFSINDFTKDRNSYRDQDERNKRVFDFLYFLLHIFYFVVVLLFIYSSWVYMSEVQRNRKIQRSHAYQFSAGNKAGRSTSRAREATISVMHAQSASERKMRKSIVNIPRVDVEGQKHMIPIKRMYSGMASKTESVEMKLCINNNVGVATASQTKVGSNIGTGITADPPSLRISQVVADRISGSSMIYQSQHSGKPKSPNSKSNYPLLTPSDQKVHVNFPTSSNMSHTTAAGRKVSKSDSLAPTGRTCP